MRAEATRERISERESGKRKIITETRRAVNAVLERPSAIASVEDIYAEVERQMKSVPKRTDNYEILRRRLNSFQEAVQNYREAERAHTEMASAWVSGTITPEYREEYGLNRASAHANLCIALRTLGAAMYKTGLDNSFLNEFGVLKENSYQDQIVRDKIACLANANFQISENTNGSQIAKARQEIDLLSQVRNRNK